MKKFIIGLLVVVLIGAGVFWLVNRDDSEPAADTTENTTQTSATPAPTSSDDTTSSSDLAVTTTIIYTDDGFSPDSYTTKSGDSVTVQNNSSSTLNFASNDHPTHTKNPELNVGEITPGSSKTFVLTTSGTWGFHNHYDSSHGGTITVE